MGNPDKREARRFVPPPWEREQFEKLARETTDRKEKPAPSPTAEEAVAPTAEQKPESAGGHPGEVAPGKAIAPEDLDKMIEALKEEEPDATQGAWRIGLAAAVLMGTIGLMLVVWGSVALARAGSAGPVGIMGSAIMSIMGAFLVALGAWMGVRSLQQRGAL